MLMKRVLSSLIYKQIYFFISLIILISLFKLLDPKEYYYYGSLSIVFLFLRNIIDTISIQLYLKFQIDFFKHKFIFLLLILNISILFFLDFNIIQKLEASSVLILSYYLSSKCIPYICYLNKEADYKRYNIIISISEIMSFSVFVLFKNELIIAILLKNIFYFLFQLILFKLFVKSKEIVFKETTDKIINEFSLFFIFNFFSKNLDKIIVSFLFGNIVFSLYERSMALIRAVISVFSFSIAPALLLSLKEIEDRKLTRLYLRYQQILFGLAFLGLIIYNITLPFFSAYIGGSWSELITYLNGLVLAVPIMLMIGNTSQFYINQSETRLNLLSAILSFVTVMLYVLLASFIFEEFTQVARYMFIPFFINLLQINYLYLIKIRKEAFPLFVSSITIQLIYILLCLI
jgi:hypothetical protein